MLDIQNGGCADIYDIVFENINVEYNSFDTVEQYQESDEIKYEKADSIQIPVLINIDNFSFRSEENERLWKIPRKGDYGKINAVGKHGAVHGIVYRNINVFYNEGLPLNDGKPIILINFASDYDNYVYDDIEVSDIVVNGVHLKRDNAVIKKCDVKKLMFN